MSSKEVNHSGIGCSEILRSIENVRFGEIVSVRRGESCRGELHGQLIHVSSSSRRDREIQKEKDEEQCST